MDGKHALLILGGMFHDFDGFAGAMTGVFAQAGHRLTPTYDLDELTRLVDGTYDLVVSYTSLSKHRPERPSDTPQTLSPEQTLALVGWVRAGGALLGVHSATVLGVDNPAYQSLLGGRFLRHPEQFAFSVAPLSREHPITAGIEAFSVKDELYIQEYDPSLEIHMVACDRGVVHPMVWSKREGQGRVAHISMGHSPAVWDLAPFQRLMLQATDWVTAR